MFLLQSEYERMRILFYGKHNFFLNWNFYFSLCFPFISSFFHDLILFIACAKVFWKTILLTVWLIGQIKIQAKCRCVLTCEQLVVFVNNLKHYQVHRLIRQHSPRKTPPETVVWKEKQLKRKYTRMYICSNNVRNH